MLRAVAAALVVACVLRAAAAQDTCLSHVGCSACTAAAGCGFCDATEQCLAGNATGPATGICHGWIWGKGGGEGEHCPNCATITSCVACTDEDLCGWCQATGTCNPVDHACAADSCPCGVYDQCTDCTRMGCVFCPANGACYDKSSAGCSSALVTTCNCSLWSGDCASCTEQADICGWCATHGNCQSLGSTACAVSQTCPPEGCGNRRGFDAASFLGGILLGLGLFALALLGVFLWRHFFGAHSRYDSNL